MSDTTFTSGITVIPADWLNDINDFYYTTFGATGGVAYIGDTANANMTIGLTINQGAADNQLFAAKSSDVAHGMTDLVETDTYFGISKASGTAGGAALIGYTEGDVAVDFTANGVTDDTTKSTSATGYFRVSAAKKSGTSTGNIGSDGNIMVIRNNATARFIFDAEGSFHADVESTTFDEHDDVALIEAMDREFQRRNGDPIERDYAKHLKENRAMLQKLGIVNYYDKSGKRAMVNIVKQAMLHNGAIRQLAKRQEQLESRMKALACK